MKWIGQHIWDYISRFRSDVYLENIGSGTIDSGGNLGLDSNNKIVKANVPSSVTINGSTANGIATYGGASQIDIESNVTVSGTTLANLGGTLSVVAGGELALFGSPKVSVTSGRIDISGSTASAGYINLYEDTDNGTNAVKLIGPTSCSDRTITLPDATGTVALTQKTIVVDRASYWSNDTGSNPYYIPFDYFTESTSLTTASYRNFHVAPYDGRVVSIASFHQSSSTRTSTIEMYIDGDDSDLVADQRGSDLSSGSHGQKFQVDCPADWTFSKGEALAFRRTDNAATYGATMTIVFEYDITT